MTILLVVTMRARNGYAGLHELISRTRVVAIPDRYRARVTVPSLEAEYGDADDIDTKATPRIGDYRVLRTIWRDGPTSFVVAFDDILKRQVWIHQFADEAAP